MSLLSLLASSSLSLSLVTLPPPVGTRNNTLRCSPGPVQRALSYHYITGTHFETKSTVRHIYCKITKEINPISSIFVENYTVSDWFNCMPHVDQVTN